MAAWVTISSGPDQSYTPGRDSTLAQLMSSRMVRAPAPAAWPR